MALSPRARHLLGLAAFVLAVGGGVAYALRARGDAAPRADRKVLLDATEPVPADGLLLAFRLEAPGEVEVRVDLPEGAETEVEVGFPAPASGAGGTHLAPDPAKSRRFRASGAAKKPWVQPFFSVGNYAIRVRPFSAGAGESPLVRVRVTAR